MSAVLISGQAYADFEGIHGALTKLTVDTDLKVCSDFLSIGHPREYLFGGGCVVLIYVEPSLCIARAMKDAADEQWPDLVGLMNRWRLAGEAMLALAVRHPDRCLLVNDYAGVCAHHRLASMVDQVLGLRFTVTSAADDQVTAGPSASKLAPIEALLAASLVASDPGVSSLFVELESCAHLARGDTSTARDLATVAWRDYMALQSRLHQSEGVRRTTADPKVGLAHDLQQMTRQRADCERKLVDLVQDRDRQSAVAVRANALAEASAAELDRQTETAQKLRSENKSLLLQLELAHTEAERLSQQAAALTREVAALERTSTDAATTAEAARARLGESESVVSAQMAQMLIHANALLESRKELSALRAANNTMSRHLSELEAEGRLHRQLHRDWDSCRLQMSQLSTEMLTLHSICDGSAALLAQAETRLQQWTNFWRDQHGTEVCVDLRRSILGTNWYSAESDGRWTGPGLSSTLSIPALRPGRYKVQITLVGAMSPQIASGLRVDVNGIQLDLRFNRAKHPRLGKALVKLPDNLGTHFILNFLVPAVESPAARGSDDHRLLGVRVNEVKFIAVAEV